jgi:plasmid maintenance system antidote protein VapI
MNMQKRYELDMAREEQEEAQREIQPFEMA